MPMSKQAFEVAVMLGVLSAADVASGIWHYRGQRAGQYAFENARNGEWRFC